MKPIEELAKECAGNHLEFSDFCWFTDVEKPGNWFHWRIDSRDSELVTQSNADQIRQSLDPYISDTVLDESHNHWACGYVGVLCVLVYQDGQITKAFREVYNILERLENYPLLDEEDYCNREYEDTIENIENNKPYILDNEPEDWAKQVYSWLWDNNQDEIEPQDGFGGYPSTEAITEACKALGFDLDE